ncbi:EAL domain-containing protein [Methylophilus aquaticus]|uniref:EAL domain-containing protein n=1 Tax=Methylophilus aquaticus TaxID=1971610 RepID=A0ABT9JSH7_9PROT|nr:EAL domain-containing protein [Methylophilus aquaticus]MDP8567485.1 EAL domain-containing protein [Methylophilus aquaticus]
MHSHLITGMLLISRSLVVFFWALLSYPAQASSAHTSSITVISDDNYPPYLFKDADGNTVGIVADIWALWEQKTGVKVTLVSTVWESAQQQLLSGQADVIEMIFKNSEREKNYAYSPPYAQVPVGIYAHESLTGLTSPASLSGFTVGAQKGDGCIFKLKEAGVKSFRLYNSYEEIIQAVLHQQVKIVCMDDYPARYYLYRLDNTNQVRRAFGLYEGQFHRAVSKNNLAMLALVEKGMVAISPHEVAAIEEKWKGSYVQAFSYSKRVFYLISGLGLVAAIMALSILTLRLAVKRKTLEIENKSLEIEHQRARLQNILDATRAGTWEWNVQTGECQFNARWAEMLGYASGELMPFSVETAQRLIHPDDWQKAKSLVAQHLAGESEFYECDIRMRHKQGYWIWVADRGQLIPRSAAHLPLMMSGTHIDITEKKEAEQEIWRQANYDSLTQLPNRHYFNCHVLQGLESAKENKQRVALLALDLDRFKEVNDTLGHHRGDELLVQAGQRIRNEVEAQAMVARLGGDEFAIMLPLVSDAALAKLCERLLGALSSSYVLEGERVFVTASIGVSIFPDDAATAAEMMRHSDQAMYDAKNNGRNQFRVFTPAMQEALDTRMALARDLRLAVENGELRDYYQPIVDLHTGEIVKAEALMRWQHPALGLIGPTVFIPVAEEIGAIIEMGDWIFQQAAHHILQWQSLVGAAFAISVNKSPVQFTGHQLSKNDWVSHLRYMGIEGRRIVVEITEGLLLNPDPEIEDILLHFRDAGIQVAIDDFGTGYSSLSYLTKFDIDYLKIDQSFTRHLNEGNESYVLCEAIIVMAHKLGLKVIAEGVETALQRDLLRAIHCDFAQGYFYSPPVPAETFKTLLEQGKVTATQM